MPSGLKIKVNENENENKYGLSCKGPFYNTLCTDAYTCTYYCVFSKGKC